MFSHFIAINALASVAMRSEGERSCACRVMHQSQSSTYTNGTLELVRLGDSMVQGEVR